MPASKAQIEAVARYKAKTYKRVPLEMPFADYDRLKAAADAAGEKVNTYIKKAIAMRMEQGQE